MTKKSDAPAIRFKGFSDAWEQRKAIDISRSISLEQKMTKFTVLQPSSVLMRINSGI